MADSFPYGDDSRFSNRHLMGRGHPNHYKANGSVFSMLNFEFNKQKIEKAKANGFEVEERNDVVIFKRGTDVYTMHPNGSGTHYCTYYEVSVPLSAKTMEVYLCDKKR
ncbi:hypothetical protein ACFSO7_22415 [Bacillus sp. CGMCC 1.16607]|uniref:hypothetical protein n=1 Tax=Bacillus sp. CGMCC 1.16607 TaxID=3351842 RepID=UPI00363D515A